MTCSALPFVLAGGPAKFDLEHVGPSAKAVTAARFWAGKYKGSNAKAACVERIAAVWRDETRVRQALAALRPAEWGVLSVVKRFGGSISGTLLGPELASRGLLPVEDPNETVWARVHGSRSDPVLALCERLVLLGASDDGNYYSYGSSYGSFRGYPDVALPSQLAPFVEPAAPLTWSPSTAVADGPEATAARATTQMLVDLEQTARALEARGGWKTNQGGGLPVAMRNRLAKLHPLAANDPFVPPDVAALDYFLLEALGVVERDRVDARLNRERADALFRQPPVVQASDWVRAWLSLRLWQDGIGAVPDRDSEANPTRVEPRRLRRGREVLAWALGRVAHSRCNDWLDLETFVLDLYAAADGRRLSFYCYWGDRSWRPGFVSAAGKEAITSGPERYRAFWMEREGAWVANALLCTLVHLGVVERGEVGGAGSGRWCFRLTDVGRAVFGAPEVTFETAVRGDTCLTVQPNHEVLLYLDAADGEAVTTLGRMASRESAAGIVQTFKLTRDSIYGALEAGMTPAAIESFLSSRSRSGLPANVSQSLAEWSRKREALVVRSGVSVRSIRDGVERRGRAPERRLVLASSRAASEEATVLGIDNESNAPRKEWKVDEHGVVSTDAPLSVVGKARLRRFARFTNGNWRVDADSVRAARVSGIDGDQVLAWLEAHATCELPPVLTMAIRNWASGRARASLGSVALLQVGDPRASEALRGSERLRPFVQGVLAPGCFVVTDEGREEVARLLRELGFSIDEECKFDPPAVSDRVSAIDAAIIRRLIRSSRAR